MRKTTATRLALSAGALAMAVVLVTCETVVAPKLLHTAAPPDAEMAAQPVTGITLKPGEELWIAPRGGRAANSPAATQASATSAPTEASTGNSEIFIGSEDSQGQQVMRQNIDSAENLIPYADLMVYPDNWPEITRKEAGTGAALCLPHQRIKRHPSHKPQPQSQCRSPALPSSRHAGTTAPS